MNGAFFENFVVIEILKNFLNNGKNPSLFLYRDTELKEIDLIIEQNRQLFPIEIKLTVSPNKAMVKNFSILPEDKYTSGALICMTSDDYPITSKVNAIPVWYL